MFSLEGGASALPFFIDNDNKMAQKEYLVLKQFYRGGRMYQYNDDASHFNPDTLKILLRKNLVGLRWKPNVIPLKPKEDDKPKKNKNARRSKD